MPPTRHRGSLHVLAFSEELEAEGEYCGSWAGSEYVRAVSKEAVPLSADTDGLLSQALLLGDLRSAVELCLKEERFADAIILAQAGDTELLKWTQERYLAKRRTKTSSYSF